MQEDSMENPAAEFGETGSEQMGTEEILEQARVLGMSETAEMRDLRARFVQGTEMPRLQMIFGEYVDMGQEQVGKIPPSDVTSYRRAQVGLTLAQSAVFKAKGMTDMSRGYLNDAAMMAREFGMPELEESLMALDSGVDPDDAYQQALIRNEELKQAKEMSTDY